MKTTKQTNTGNGQVDGRFVKRRWDIARLFPEQGSWSAQEYLDYSGNRLVEFDNGYLEILPMPTTTHQWIMLFLWESLRNFAGGWTGLGFALTAGIRVQLWEGKFREPDVVFMLTKNKRRVFDEYWVGADLAMEVVSGDPEDRHRDLVEKRSDYARARIGEYWIVDPKHETITVLRLKGKSYEVHGVFKSGQTATSKLLPGYAVDVAAVFARP